MNSGCSWRGLAQAWQRFFFLPVDPLPCDVVRIGYAGLVLFSCLTEWRNVRMWYGETGVLPYDVARMLIDEDTWTIFAYLPKTDATAWICFGLLTAQAFLLLAGVWSRFQAVCVYIWLISFHHRNLLILDAEDSVFRLVGFLLMFMPIGYSWAWDARRRRLSSPRELVERPCWALRLLQIEMCLIFAGCALSKLRSADWLDGTAMYYTSRLDDLFGRFPTPDLLWESMTIMKLIGWGAIAIETLVPLLVWFRETRWAALLLAAAFHLTCDYTMNLYLFHWIMLVGWSSFITAADWHSLRSALPWCSRP